MSPGVIENKICKQCQGTFPICDKDIAFYNKISPSIGGKIFEIPHPTLCPDCRQMRRLVWRNDRKLYKRKCNATGKEMISVFSPDKVFRVFDPDFYWSDAWQLEISKKDFDFSAPFFTQFSELFKATPKRALLKGTGSTNCAYASLVGASEDGYLIFNGTNSRQCLYTDGMSDVERCVDCSQIRNSSNCYEAIDVINCNRCSYIQDCQDCSFCDYMFDCINCHNCFACTGLRNKSYYILNKPYKKEEYFIEKQRLIETGFGPGDFKKFSLDCPRVHLKILGSENASGDMIYNSHNIHQSYEIYDAHDIRYCVNIYRGAHDCMDVNVGLNNGNKLYEVSLSNKSCYNILFSHDVWNYCENLIYCTECKKTKDCFGCCGLLDKQYCILNKQYTKQQYEEIVPKIIEYMKKNGEWGEFFPMECSPFGYNESAAQEFYPLERDDALALGASWSDYKAEFARVEKILSSSKIPKNISDIPNDILGWAIECEISKKPFRIVKQELEYYRKYNLPIPKRHPDQRYQDRLNMRTPRRNFEKKCNKCKVPIPTSYHPDGPQKILCTDCYNKQIY